MLSTLDSQLSTVSALNSQLWTLDFSMNDEQLRSVLMLAASKIGVKESRRELLSVGAYQVILRLSGTVDGLAFRGQKIEGRLAIAPDTERSSSFAAPQGDLVAYLLGQMPSTRRKAILAGLPDEFLAAGGKLPECDAELIEAAETLLERLRSRRTTTAAGAVSWSFAEPPKRAA